MPVLRGLTDVEAQALGLPAGTSEVTSRGAKTPTSYTPGRWRQAKTYLLPPDPASPGKLRHQMHIGRDVHYEDDGGNWRNIDLNWQADPTNPGEFVTDRNDIYTRVTRYGVAVWDRKRKIGLRWSTTARPSVGGRQASFPKDGLTWTWSATTGGLKLESEPVAAPRGPQTYEWRYLVIDLNRLDGFNLLGTLSADAGGNLVGDGFVTPRAYAIGANGLRYDCGKWQVVPAKTRAVSFAFDDSILPPEAFPYVIDPTTTFNVAVSADDGYVARSGSPVYPPNTTSTATPGNQFIFPERSFANPNYTVGVGLVRWDTSALPDTATITGATAHLTLTNQRAQADARNVVIEWYAATNWPIDAGDYTATSASNAHAGTLISTLALDTAKDFALTNITNVNLTGYTGIRIHIDGGQPTGYNYAGFGSFDHATVAYRPQLIIDYTDGAPAPAPLDLGIATASGTATTAAALSSQMGLTAAAQTAGQATATLSLLQGLTAAATGQATTVATLGQLLGLTAQASTTATATATLSQLLGLIATSTTTGTGTATLTILSATITPLDMGTATATGSGQAMATLGLSMGLTPNPMSATGSATANLGLLMGLSAQATATGHASAELSQLMGLVSNAVATGTASASLAFMSEIVVLVVNVTVAMPGTVNQTVQFPGAVARTVVIPDQVEVK